MAYSGWGFSAIFSNGIVTDLVNWRCTTQLQANWNGTGFNMDPLIWTPAATPWGGSYVHCGDTIIWCEDRNKYNNIYCRYAGQL